MYENHDCDFRIIGVSDTDEPGDVRMVRIACPHIEHVLFLADARSHAEPAR